LHLLFFTPTEELQGGNIFQHVSSNYSVMQPYLEKIDGEFIKLMNKHVQNIAMYVKPNYMLLDNVKVQTASSTLDESSISNVKHGVILDNTE
jgi:hypothetical protein